MKTLTVTQKADALAFAELLAQNVGDKIARKASRRKHIAFKGEVDLVTQFDREAQRLILRRTIVWAVLIAFALLSCLGFALLAFFYGLPG